MWVIPQSEEHDQAPFELCGDSKTIYISDYFFLKMSTASHNSNESMPDESMEVRFADMSMRRQMSRLFILGDWA